MELPPLDHVGWGRLLSAVMQTDPVATGAPVEGRRDTSVDTDRLRRRAELARTIVLEGQSDIYA